MEYSASGFEARSANVETTLVGVCVDDQAPGEHQEAYSARDPEGSSFGSRIVEHGHFPHISR